MVIVTDKKKCSGCSACYNSCPVDAISMKRDNEGFLYPIIDEEKCINCNKCDKSCPYVTKKEISEDMEKTYAGYIIDEEIRKKSSSGGIFALLARNILKNNGVVCGAAFTQDFQVYHKIVADERELDALMGSKYVQSSIGTVFSEIKNYLKADKDVLFVGTACQVAGLKNYLGEKYDKLLCLDFICLGIPSPRVWADYLKTYFNLENIEEINFKDKSLGWHRYSLRIKEKNNEYCKDGRKTYFFTGYFNGLTSRPSCSECIFKEGKRVSDITISDCWGYNVIAPELDDNKGLSSIVIHTEKGMEWFDKIKSQLIYKEASINDVKKYNSNYCTSYPMGKNRDKFWKDYERIPFNKLMEKYCKPEKRSLYKRIISSIYRKVIKRNG